MSEDNVRPSVRKRTLNQKPTFHQDNDEVRLQMHQLMAGKKGGLWNDQVNESDMSPIQMLDWWTIMQKTFLLILMMRMNLHYPQKTTTSIDVSVV